MLKAERESRKPGGQAGNVGSLPGRRRPRVQRRGALTKHSRSGKQEKAVWLRPSVRAVSDEDSPLEGHSVQALALQRHHSHRRDPVPCGNTEGAPLAHSTCRCELQGGVGGTLVRLGSVPYSLSPAVLGNGM